jgi:thioredoxin-like negative regulator of GroEL
MKVVKCYHDYCPQCPAVDKWLPKACAALGVPCEALNVMEDGAMAARLGIQSVPAIVILRDGETPVVLTQGLVTAQAFQKTMASLVG